VHPERLLHTEKVLHEKIIKLNFRGNEVYHTNSLVLLVKDILCSKLHCQKGFYLILFSYKVVYPPEANTITVSQCDVVLRGRVHSERLL